LISTTFKILLFQLILYEHYTLVNQWISGCVKSMFVNNFLVIFLQF